jgi:hypothetical protein
MILDSESLMCKIHYLVIEWRRCLSARHRILENLIGNVKTRIGKATTAQPGNTEPQLAFYNNLAADIVRCTTRRKWLLSVPASSRSPRLFTILGDRNPVKCMMTRDPGHDRRSVSRTAAFKNFKLCDRYLIWQLISPVGSLS